MLGLVLWCDGAARHALIWCGDQGDLAIYDRHASDEGPPILRAGDLVLVGLARHGPHTGPRRACSLRVVARAARTDLPQRLRQAARAARAAG